MAEPKELRRLPESEWTVMESLWSCPSPATRGEIQAKLPEDHPLAVTTVLTLLSRLGEKGYLKTEKEGRTTRYLPLVRREDYLSAQSRHFLDRLCGGSLPVFAQALCDGGLTRAEIDELRELLERGTL